MSKTQRSRFVVGAGCPYCSRAYTSDVELASHIRKQHTFADNSTGDLTREEIFLGKWRPLEREKRIVYGQDWLDVAAFKTAIVRSTPYGFRPYAECPKCAIRFTTQKQALVHSLEQCKDVPARSDPAVGYACPHCGKVRNSRAKALDHIRFSCDVLHPDKPSPSEAAAQSGSTSLPQNDSRVHDTDRDIRDPDHSEILGEPHEPLAHASDLHDSTLSAAAIHGPLNEFDPTSHTDSTQAGQPEDTTGGPSVTARPRSHRRRSRRTSTRRGRTSQASDD